MNEGKQSYPKKMNAFWKNTAIPGYTTGFSDKTKTSPSIFGRFKHVPSLMFQKY